MATEKQSDKVRRIQEELSRQTHELLRQNQLLRIDLAKAESDKIWFQEELFATRQRLAESEALRVLTASLRTEKERLTEELQQVEAELRRHRQQEERLQQTLEGIEESSRELSAQYLEVERQNATLTNLFVTAYRLHSTSSSAQILEAIQEVVINLVGSEELLILELDDSGSSLVPIASFGVEADRFARIDLVNSVLGRTIAAGQVAVPSQQPVEGLDPNITAVVPLLIEERVTGAIVIFQLLQQKPALEPVDLEMFDLLASNAAIALHCARLHEAPRQILSYA